MTNDVYYKIYANRDDLITVVCMQDFDEDDYHQDRFYRNESNEILRFDLEDDAVEFINKKFKPEYIDEEFRRTTGNFWKEREL